MGATLSSIKLRLDQGIRERGSKERYQAPCYAAPSVPTFKSEEKLFDGEDANESSEEENLNEEYESEEEEEEEEAKEEDDPSKSLCTLYLEGVPIDEEADEKRLSGQDCYSKGSVSS